MDALLLYPNGSQYFAERGIDDQAGLSVVGGGALVDQGQPIPAVIADQPRRRVHRQEVPPMISMSAPAMASTAPTMVVSSRHSS